MQFGKVLAISVISALWTVPAFSQTLDTVSQPAELPPAGFTGSSFVDSRGCVFFRAGFDGRERWVPRVLRSKKLVCGFKPSFEKSQTRSIAEANSAGSSAPVQITLDGAAPTAPTAQAAPTIATPTVIGTRVEPAQPVIMASTKVAPAPRVVPATRVIAPPKKVEPVLPTGPEVVRPATGITKVPSGYKAAWSDDRLNPKRGIPTAAGIAASDLRWTRTVPRKLIQRSTGLDVTAQFTKLNYPFTDLKQQARFMAARDSYKLVVQPDGAVIMRPVADSVSNAKPKMRVSSKGASASQASGHGRFIQVGAFGSPSNSNRTLSKIASLGLPAAQSKITRGGSNLTVVMAGPFHSAGSAQSALQQLKQSGFSDAYIR